MKLLGFLASAILIALCFSGGELFATVKQTGEYCDRIKKGDKAYSDRLLKEFEELGEIQEFLPLETENGFCRGWASGAAVKVKEEFKLDEDHKGWVIERDEEGCRGGTEIESPCDSCPKDAVCSLWLPGESHRFEYPLP
jgi:hypothetical protein